MGVTPFLYGYKRNSCNRFIFNCLKNMNKELQDLAWSCLPKEFKEEVKKIYSHNPGAKRMPENTSRGKAILRDIFGHDNLTSDAEGEEMLTVSRKRVQEIYNSYCAERDKEEPGSNRSSLGGRIAMLEELFGSKCLPDVPSKLQASCRQVKEPNGTIVGTKGPDYSNATKIGKDCKADSSDHIADVSNMMPPRLHIAAMAMQGMLSNPEFGKKYCDYLHCCRKGDDVIDETLYYAQKALNIADTLIAETVSSAQPLCPTKKVDTL